VPQGLRFGICTDQNMAWDLTVERWRLFEDLGFDSLWDCDHYVQPSRPTGPYFEGWSLLAGLAAVTRKARIGVLVSCNTFRHPALVAKMAMTIDHISNGRVDVGLGAGWYVPEHTMYGLDFPSPPELVGRFREAVEIVDGLLRNETTSYAGRYYQLADARFLPRPIQQPRPPLTLGAHGPRMMRVVAQYADAWNSFGTVDEMRERNRILDEQCAAVGRDPSEIWRGLYGWAAMMPADPWESPDAFADMIGQYREAGVNEFIIDQPRTDQLDLAERVATDVLPKLRADASR
jgi:alkanesulfonate monooxygenase SsuD/methylene tetrahydromethanopterin reductase-like flavin-dependent oxidoreductase (luciferase family)